MLEGWLAGPPEEAAGVIRWYEEPDSAEDISLADPGIIVGRR